MDRPLSFPALVRLRPAALRLPSWGRLLRRLDCGRSRRRLADLDDHILRDIGLTRDQALQEAERPIWDVPAHWLR